MERKTESSDSHDWSELTQVCLVNIISRLALEERCCGPILVCKPWLHACKDPSLNSVIDLEPHFISAVDSPTPEFEAKINSMLRSVILWSNGFLTTVRVRHCSHLSLSLLAQRSPNLQVLSIKDSPHATDETMTMIASGCPLLRELDISFCSQISHISLALIGQHCPNLQILRRNFMKYYDPLHHRENIFPVEYYLDVRTQDDDSDAVAIGKFMPQLVRLELRFSKLSKKGLALISEGCTNLEHLDLTGCKNVTSQDVSNAKANLKQLKTLTNPRFYFAGYIPLVGW